MNDEKLEQLKQNLTKMKAYMDDITPKNATLANNAAWKWIHKSMGTSLELFEPEVVEPSEDGLFPDETPPELKPETDPLTEPESEQKPESIPEMAAAEDPIEDLKDEDIKGIKVEEDE